MTTGNHIHDNVIVDHDSTGKIGGVADYNWSGMANGGNTWSNNHYFMPDVGNRFCAVTSATTAVGSDTTSKISRLPAVRVARFHRTIPAPRIGLIYQYTRIYCHADNNGITTLDFAYEFVAAPKSFYALR